MFGTSVYIHFSKLHIRNSAYTHFFLGKVQIHIIHTSRKSLKSAYTHLENLSKVHIHNSAYTHFFLGKVHIHIIHTSRKSLKSAYTGVVHIDFCQISLTWCLCWGGVRASRVLENLRNERIGIRAFQKTKNYRKRFTELGERASQRPSIEQPDS